jgi:hypothetical protein
LIRAAIGLLGTLWLAWNTAAIRKAVIASAQAGSLCYAMLRVRGITRKLLFSFC